MRGESLVVAAPAKINLSLLVGPRRADGFHPLDSYVARITLYDTIELRPRSDGGIRLICSGADCGPDRQNLALRAAELLADHAAGGVDIHLTKGIRPGLGLGGGSSDAAGVLLALNQMWHAGLARAELAEAAEQLGSDVPLFLGPAAARMTGRGEQLRPIDLPDFWAVLCMPEVHVSTEQVYRQFDRGGAAPATQPPPEALAGPPSAWRGLLSNQLTDAAERLYGVLGTIRRQLGAAGLPVAMSGSGGAMFMLCDDFGQAEGAMARLPDEVRRFCTVVRSNPW